MSLVPLCPEAFSYGRLRPPSRLQMNSLRSALTAVLAGLKASLYRGQGELEFIPQTGNSQFTENLTYTKSWTLPDLPATSGHQRNRQR